MPELEVKGVIDSNFIKRIHQAKEHGIHRRIVLIGSHGKAISMEQIESLTLDMMPVISLQFISAILSTLI